jgi:hypothetical protein
MEGALQPEAPPEEDATPLEELCTCPGNPGGTRRYMCVKCIVKWAAAHAGPVGLRKVEELRANKRHTAADRLLKALDGNCHRP